jgi:hypothetical protein
VREAPVIVSASGAVFRPERCTRCLVGSGGFPLPKLREIAWLGDGTAIFTEDPAASQAGKRYVIRIIAINGVGRRVTKALTIVIRRISADAGEPRVSAESG